MNYRLAIGAMALAFLAVFLAVGTAAWFLYRTQVFTGAVSHTYEVEVAIRSFQSLYQRAETTRRGFLLQPDGDFRAIFETTVGEMPAALDAIAALVADNPQREAEVARLRELSRAQVEALTRSIERAAADGGAARAAFASDGSVAISRSLRAASDAMIQGERDLLAERRARQAASVVTSYATIGLAGVLLVGFGVGAVLVARQNIRDLTRSRNGLAALNENLEGAVNERTADLQRANEEIQRFAYIVSHDLRSPLVNVMGFTSELDAARQTLADMLRRAEEAAPETVDAEARRAVEEDLPEAIGFIRSSTQKMDRLINAILKLSREGRRVIQPEPLDMAALVRGICDTLQHRLDALGAAVSVEQPLPDIVSDRVAVEQILSNLVENAVKYLKPGRPGRIVLRGTRSGGHVVYEVEDNGRGIDPKDHERIFDLFRRSGTQDQPGEGIGLAHVRALAYRLGGIVSCRSALDRGATFSLSLPAVFIPSKAGVS